MQWTDHLDPIFVSNYEMDPVLSWQYFGSTKGTLRRFPSKCILVTHLLAFYVGNFTTLLLKCISVASIKSNYITFDHECRIL